MAPTISRTHRIDGREEQPLTRFVSAGVWCKRPDLFPTDRLILAALGHHLQAGQRAGLVRILTCEWAPQLRAAPPASAGRGGQLPARRGPRCRQAPETRSSW